MGFFDLKAECAICGKEAGLNRYRIADKKWMCPDCFKRAGFKKLAMEKSTLKMTVEEIKTAIALKKENDSELDSFTATKKIGSFIEFDDNQKKWLLPSAFGNKKNSKVYNYSDIIDFELLEDGESITKGGLGRALVGGALFGGAGAIVGGVTGKKKNKGVCTTLKIKITVRDMKSPAVYINFINSQTKKDGLIYKGSLKLAHECLSTLQLICDELEPPSSNSNNASVQSNADEIKKYKELLDEGIITQEEFDAKKKILLGL